MVYKTRIYIVESERSVAIKLKRSLEEEGYNVVGLCDLGEEAIPNILRIKPDFILIDVNLKGKIDGIKAAIQITRKHSIPMAFLTQGNDEDAIKKAELNVHYSCIAKPYDQSQLRLSIERTLFPIDSGEDDTDDIIDQTETTHVKKLEMLRHVELFKNIPEEHLVNFVKGTSIRSIDAGTFISSGAEDDEENAAGFIVISGKISIMKSSITGKELTVSLLGANDVFGLFFLLKDFPGSCTARTQIDSRVLWVQKSAFEAIKVSCPEFNNALIEAMSTELIIAYELSSGLAHSRVEDRIVTAILTLLPRLGQISTKGTDIATKTKINSRLLMTRKELADLTGTTPETAIRITKNLEREGYLDLSRPGIIKIVNLEGLQSIVTT